MTKPIAFCLGPRARSFRTVGLRSFWQLVLVLLATSGCVRSAAPGGQASALFEVEPVRATVVVDGTPMLAVDPSTPGRIPLSAGRHRIEVQADGYEIWRQDVRLRGGEVYEISVQLWPLIAIPH